MMNVEQKKRESIYDGRREREERSIEKQMKTKIYQRQGRGRVVNYFSNSY